jgi:5'-methylthioadenosine phosphorylase
MANHPTVIGVIGGSGLYALDGLEQVEERTLETPFGAPSDALTIGVLHGTPIVFLPRHDRGHTRSPTTINYRANIWALRSLGVTDIVSVSAVGSMREDYPPGHVVLPDQFIDRTVSRPRSFFGDGCVAHVGFSQPISKRTQAAVQAALEALEIPHAVGGAYVCIEGPQFSTRAESELFRTWPDVAVIGMTNLPEARLAREAEMGYATVAMVTDYDCWHDGHDAVTVDQVVAVLRANVDKARRVVDAVCGAPPTGPCESDNALKNAIMTRWDRIPQQTRARLALFLDRYDPARGGSSDGENA